MVSISKMNDHYVVKFAGFDSIDKARKISGESIYVEESDLPALKKGEYYFYQIIGSDVYYESGEFVGPVKDIIQTGSNDVLIIGEEEILIPVIKDYIVNMDIKSKKITVRKLEWF
jgi:16S rRNA processing protein RimM